MPQTLKANTPSSIRSSRTSASSASAAAQWQAFSLTATAGAPADQIALIRLGVSSDIVLGAALALGLPVEALWGLLACKFAGTRSRSSRGPARLDSAMTERLFRLARIADEAVTTFDDRSVAASWLLEPNLGLGGATPLSMLDTQAGAGEVQRILVSIRYGGVC